MNSRPPPPPRILCTFAMAEYGHISNCFVRQTIRFMTVFGHIQKVPFNAGEGMNSPPPRIFMHFLYGRRQPYNISTCFVHIQTIRYMAVFGHIKNAFLSLGRGNSKVVYDQRRVNEP
jgi:hypothetical protein